MSVDFASLGGWVRDEAAVEAVLRTLPFPIFSAAAPHLKGSGAGEDVLLYKAYKDVNGGSYISYPAQEIGCCVGRGFSAGVDLLQAVEITLKKEREEFKPTSHEAVYAMSRIDIGGQRGSYSDGSVGAWAAKAVNTLGILNRELVGEYSDKRAKEWGAKGVPAELKAKAKDHLVRTVSLVSTYEELEAALANGYPVPVCSDQGFTLERDSQGFCAARGTWMHCMLIIGVRGGSRPGACILQSWGMNVPSGPLDLDQPSNSFWAERRVVERMLAQRDTFALSAFDGYPARVIPEAWKHSGFAFQ